MRFITKIRTPDPQFELAQRIFFAGMGEIFNCVPEVSSFINGSWLGCMGGARTPSRPLVRPLVTLVKGLVNDAVAGSDPHNCCQARRVRCAEVQRTRRRPGRAIWLAKRVRLTRSFSRDRQSTHRPSMRLLTLAVISRQMPVLIN